MPVYKDKERGTWYCTYRLPKPDGSVIHKKKRGFTLKADAQKFEARMTLDPEKDILNSLTFDDIYFHYLDNYKLEVLEETYNGNLLIHDKYILPFFKNMRLSKITPVVINNWLLSLNKFNLKFSSKKKYFGLLKLILNHGEKYFSFDHTVLLRVGTLKDRKNDYEEMSFLTLDEFKLFCKHLNTTKKKAIFHTLFWTGIRKGEFLALQWDDISQYSISICKTLKRNGTIKYSTKNGESRRIQIPKKLFDLLHKYKTEEEEKWGSISGSDFVFGYRDKPASHNTINQLLERVLKKSDTKNVRVHDFRHSHASYLIHNNVNIKTISNRLGHKNVSMTLDVYSHIYPNAEDSLIKIIDGDF